MNRSVCLRARLAALPLAVLAACSSTAFAQPGTLPDTVVRATRFAEPAGPLPLGVSVVTAAEIRASGATTVNEALVRVLGIPGRQDSFGGGESSLDLRGFGETAGSNQVVVIDGERLNEADISGARMSGIPIDAVERIEVLRGSGAVLYGEGATGGVIVITTKAGLGTERRNTASVQVGAGTDRLRDTRASATLAAGGFSIDVHGHKRDSDNHRDNFRSDSDAASLAGQWTNGWLRLGARHAREDLDSRLPGALTREEFQANPRQTTTPNDFGGIRTERNGLFAEAQLGAWQLGADLGRRKQEIRSSFDFSGFVSNYDVDIDADTLGLRARHETAAWGGRNVLVVGYDRSRWDRQVLGFFGSDAAQRTRAWYLKNDAVLAGGTRLSAGARTERITKDDSAAPQGLADRQLAWELGASQPVGAATVYGRVGRSFRLAAVDEFSFTAPAAALRPQTSRDLELGARWGGGADKLDVRLYRSQLEDEIGFDPAAFNGSPFFPGANVNFDRTRRQGLELDASRGLTRALTLRLNAALRQSVLREGAYAGNDIPLAARRTLALRADWVPVAAHRVSGGVNWVSSQRADFANTCSIPSYATADARYAYQWQQLELAVGVTNLADRKYFSQAFACAGGEATSVYPEAGRRVLATARLQF